MSKYEHSRTVKSYECQREHLAFDIHSKIYKAQEDGPGLYCSGFFGIVANKDLKKYLAVVDRNYKEDITMDQFSKNVDKIREIPLYAEESIVASKKANERYIPKVTRLALRKLTIAYLNKLGCQRIEIASNEKQFNSGFVLTYKDLNDLYSYIFSKIYGEDSGEVEFNKLVKKLPKSFYTLDQEKCPDIKLDANKPIPFTNVSDSIDYSQACDSFIRQISRIRQLYIAVHTREGQPKKQASVVWFL